MMRHHVIDYSYMYYYAMFNGFNGVMSGFILRP